VILLDQLKQIYIDGELDPVETGAYFPKIRRKDYTISLKGLTLMVNIVFNNYRYDDVW